MKFILIAAVALLALAHGSYAEEAISLEKLNQYFEEMRTKITTDFTELMNNQDLANKAQSIIADGRTQLEPLVAQFEEHIKPLAANMQAQAQPMLENFQQQVEAIFKKLMDQTQAVAN